MLAAFALAGMLAFNQPANHRNLAKGAPQEVRILDPFNKLILQNLWRQERRRVSNRLQTPNSQGIVIGNKAHGRKAAILHPAGNQHAERLVRIPPLESVKHAVMPLGMGEAFDQQLPRPRHLAAPILHLQPFAHIIGKTAPASTVHQHGPHPFGKVRGERHARPAIRWDHRRFLGSAHDHFHILQRHHL